MNSDRTYDDTIPDEKFEYCIPILMYFLTININQRTIGPENAHLKPDPAVLSHHEMTLTLNTHTPLLNS